MNRNSADSFVHISAERKSIIKELYGLIDQGLQLKVIKECILPRFIVRLVYLNKVRAAKRRDSQLQKMKFEVQQGQSWEVGERQLLDSELVQITSEGKDVSFSARDLVFLKVSPTKGVMRLVRRLSKLQGTLGQLRFDHELEKWHTDWCYHQNCRGFIQFLCIDVEKIPRILRMKFSLRQLSSTKI